MKGGQVLLKLLFVDLETTGVDPQKNGIIQISGAVQIRDGIDIVKGETFNYQLTTFPNDIIESKALEVTGVTREDILTNPARLQPIVAHRKFTAMLGKYVEKFVKTDKFFIVGFQTTFDDNFLRVFFQKCNDKYYGSFVSWPPIDLASMTAFKIGARRMLMPNFKLNTVAEAIGVPVDQSRLHDASYDIDLTISLFDYCNGRIFLQPVMEVGNGSTSNSVRTRESVVAEMPQV